jgi:hypothetical protein
MISKKEERKYYKMKSKKEQIAKKSVELALGSSFIGLPNIFRTDKLFLRIMWILLFSISLGATCFTIIKAINNYFEYEIVTNFYIFNQNIAEFPAITFFILKNSKFNIPLKEILVNCKFNTLSCDLNDFTKIQDKNDYISYRFSNKTSFASGFHYGLRVTINLTKIPFDKKCITSEMDGMRLIIHNISNDPGYYGGLPLTGFNIAPGFINEILVSKIFIYKLGQPYNNCIKNVKSIDSYDSDLFRYILQSTNYSYRQTDCFEYCVGREMYRFLNITNKIDHPANILTRLDKTKLSRVFFEIVKNKLDLCPDCPEECDSIRYETTQSFTKLANNSNDLIVFSVYYTSLDYTEINQIPKMDSYDFISNIGGNFGLFIGVSFLSFAELIEFIIEIILIFFSTKNSSINSNSN